MEKSSSENSIHPVEPSSKERNWQEELVCLLSSFLPQEINFHYEDCGLQGCIQDAGQDEDHISSKIWGDFWISRTVETEREENPQEATLSFFKESVCCTEDVTQDPQLDPATIPEPGEEETTRESDQEREGSETSLGGLTNAEDKDPDQREDFIVAGVLEDGIIAMLTKEASIILPTIVGKRKYEKMEESASPILLQLLSDLMTGIPQVQENGLEVTLEVVQKEVSKWAYRFMKNGKRKVVAHPQHIKDIPSNWLAKNVNALPCDGDYKIIAKDFGLATDQVVDLFQNERKRTRKKILSENLQSQFSAEITEKLRNWQSANPGRQPDPESLKDVMDDTKLSERQIEDWFNNHKEGTNLLVISPHNEGKNPPK